MKGQQDSSSFSYEVGGIVSSIGPGVRELSVGDRVICLHAGRFDSSFHVSETMCHKLKNDEDFEAVVGSQMPTCIAIHALRDNGRLGREEVRVLSLSEYWRYLSDCRGSSSTLQGVCVFRFHGIFSRRGS